MSVRIAVVQQDVNCGQVEANRAKALHFAAEALKQKADIVLFHEEMLIGYVPHYRELVEPIEGTTTRAFQALLKGTEALVLYGAVEFADDRYYNAALLVSARGIEAHYRKTHIFWRCEGPRCEIERTTPGDKLVTFSVKGHKSGVMICYDGDFPEMTRTYAHLGCDMLFWMNSRGSRGYDEVRRLAEINSMIMATSCPCGVNDVGGQYRGGSNIVDETATLLTDIWDKEGVILADVHPERVAAARADNPWYRGRRPELYG